MTMEGQSNSEGGGRNFYRNVTVLLSSDVNKRNDQVFMPNTINMATLKKKGKGQYVNGAHFSDDMSDEEVKRRLISLFPNLENQRFHCASAVEKGTRLEFHGERQVWDGHFMRKTLHGNSALYIFTEMTDSEWSRTLPQRPNVHTGKKSGKRKNDESASTALCKRTKECSATGVSPFGDASTPMQLNCGNMLQHRLQGHPSTTTTTTVQNNISSQNCHLNRFSKATGSQKYAISVAHTHTRTNSIIVPGHQTQASGGILPSAHPSVSMLSSPHQNTNRLLLGTTQGAGSSKVTFEPGNVFHGSAPAFPTVGSRCGLTTSDTGTIQSVVSECGGTLLSAMQQRTEEDKSNRPKVVSEVTPESGNICQRSVPAHPTVGSQASVSSHSQIGPGQLPSTCLAYHTEGDQISQNTQTSGASLPESGILHNDAFQQTAVTADPPPVLHESDSGLGSIRSNAVGVAIASNSADQSEDMSTPSEIFSSSEDSDSAWEGSREMWFECQSNGVVKYIFPSSGPILENIHFCIILTQKLPRKYRKLKLVAKFEGINVVPLHIDSLKVLTGNIVSRVAGTVKVTVEYEGSNGISIGSTLFKFINSNDRVMLEQLSKVQLGQDAIFNALKSVLGTTEPSGIGIQEATPCDAEGTGVSNVNKRSYVQPEKILTLLVYKAAEINGREFLEMVFNTSAGRVVFNHYRKSSTLPGDVARANGHTILGDFLEDVNEKLSKEVCSEDSYGTVNWLELMLAMEKKVCLPCTDDGQLVRSPDGDGDGYEADDEASPFPSPADSNTNDDELDDSEHGDIGQFTLNKNDSRDSIATKAERQRHQTGTERQAESGSSFTNRADSEMEMESLPHGTDNVEIKDAVTNVALHPNPEGAGSAEDHFVTSTVMTVAGETSNAIELSSEGGTNSSAERQNKEPTGNMTIVLPCEIKTGTLMGPYIQTTTKNTFFGKRCYDKTYQKEEQDDLEKPLGYNQEGTGPAKDHIVTSAVTTISGETPNSSERGSEVGNNSSASRHMQGPIASITKELLCGDNVERVAGHLIMMKAENTRRERNCGGKDQEQELNNLDKRPGQDNLKQQLCKKHLTVAMDTRRSPIKVPCENEDLADIENAPDFDEDTLPVARPVPELCMITNRVLDWFYNEPGFRLTSWNQPFLSPAKLQEYTNVITTQGSPLTNCFGFLDGTVRPTCRPGGEQRIVFNGHKRVHSPKFQSVALPYGLIANLYGPVEGRRHDAGMLKDSGLLNTHGRVAYSPGRKAFLSAFNDSLPIGGGPCIYRRHASI